MMRIATAVLGLMLLVACNRGIGGPPSPSGEPEQPTPSAGVVVPSASLHVDQGPGKPFTVTGTLAWDAIEGGCPFLQVDRTTRYEVLYPTGWTVDRATGDLSGPTGSARRGDTITVRGEISADRVSACQIGRILQATDVTIGR